MLKNYKSNEVGNYGAIYQLISPIGKSYIGQSWNVQKRWSAYKYDVPSQPKLFRALKKYGHNNFKYIILDLCSTQGEMDAKEKFYMEIYDSIEHGYNSREAGNSGKISEETKLKMSLSHSQEKHYNWGKKLSEECKKKISESNKSTNKGVPKSDEWKRKMSKIMKGRTGKKHSNETKEKMRLRKLGPLNPNYKN